MLHIRPGPHRGATRSLLRGLAVLAAVVVLGGCGGGTTAPGATADGRPPGVTRLDPAAFDAGIARSDRFTVDVHVPFEGTLPHTDAAVPYTDIAAAVARGVLPADRGTPIAVYCRSGPMSAAAAATLSGLGYRDVIDLAGGMRAWAGTGRPILPVAAPTP